jgi:hypothetical protein
MLMGDVRRSARSIYSSNAVKGSGDGKLGMGSFPKAAFGGIASNKDATSV